MMEYGITRAQSEEPTDIERYMGAAKQMYPGGRLWRVVRAFDRIFHPWLVKTIDLNNASILAGEAQGTTASHQQMVGVGQRILPGNPGRMTIGDLISLELLDMYALAADEGDRVASGQGADNVHPVQERRPDMTGVLLADNMVEAEIPLQDYPEPPQLSR